MQEGSARVSADKPRYHAGVVSIVIPTFNRAPLLIETLQSIVRSTWTSFEIVIADDGSTDETADRVGQFSAAYPDVALQFLELSHGGAIAARNSGVAASQGEFVYFLDSDDLLQPDGLTALLGPLSDPEVPYAVAQLAEADIHGNQVFAEGQSDSLLDFEGVVGSQWPTIVGLYRRTLLDRVGAFDASLEYGEDKEFLWRIVAGAGAPGKVIGDVIALRRNHDQGQLTDQYTPVVMGRHTIAGLEAFVSWAEANGCMREAIARAAYRRLWIAAVRVGAAGEGDWVVRAVNLAERLENWSRSSANRSLRMAFGRLPTFGFGALFAVLTLARNGLHLYRNAARRLGR